MNGPIEPDLSTLNLFLIEHVVLGADVHGLRGKLVPTPKLPFGHIAAITESTMSDDDVVGVGEYDGAAAGWGALKAVAEAVRDQKAIVKETGRPRCDLLGRY